MKLKLATARSLILEKYPSYLHPPPPPLYPSPSPPPPNWILAIVIFIAPPLGRIHASEFLNRLEGVTDMVDTTQTPNQLRKLCRGSPVDLFI